MSHYYRTTTARQTGTKVTTGHADDLGVVGFDDATTWWTRCEEHGEVMGYSTLALAKRHASDPLGWCESCADLAAMVRAKAESIIEAERIDDSTPPWCPTCGCPDGWRADGPMAVRGGHGCSRGDECPDCPTNAERYRRYLEQTRVDVELCNNCDFVGPVVADDPRGYCVDCIADTDGPTIIIWDRDVDADDRLVLREHHDRIVVNELADGKFEVLPYSALYDSPGRTVLTIVIRDSRPGETLRTTCDADTLRLLIAEALDRAETMGRYPHADEIGIDVEDVVTIAG